MMHFKTQLIGLCFALAAGSAFAEDDMKMDGMKKDGMKKDGPKKEMTMQQCKEHMAMPKKDGMKKDDAMMKMDDMCNEKMKMGGAASAPMKK